jgi:hypothetical protein
VKAVTIEAKEDKPAKQVVPEADERERKRGEAKAQAALFRRVERAGKIKMSKPRHSKSIICRSQLHLHSSQFEFAAI